MNYVQSRGGREIDIFDIELSLTIQANVYGERRQATFSRKARRSVAALEAFNFLVSWSRADACRQARGSRL